MAHMQKPNPEPAPKGPISCDVCKQEFPTINPLPAISINIGSRTNSAKIKADWQNQVQPYNVDKTYRMCHLCYLKLLGIKP